METLARYALSIGAVAALLVASSSPAHSATASATEQARVGTAVANEIHDNGPGIFGTKNVQLGPVAIERPWAIADWRSMDGNAKGEVIFLSRCDSWSVRAMVAGTFNAQDLAARGVPSDKASQLLADLSRLQRDVAYTKIGQPGLSC